jgi:hypothetical protein
MKYLWSLFVITAAYLSCGGDVYGRSELSYRCEFHFHADLTGHPGLENLLAVVKSGGAIKVCSSSTEDKVYYLASPVSEKNRVHYFSLRQIFKTPVADGFRWEYSPPKNSLQLASHEVYMQGEASGTPRQDDSGFIVAQGVTAGVFRIINDSWKGIVSSEKQFNGSCCLLSMPLLLSYYDIRQLKSALYGDGHKDVPRLLGVEFVEAGAYAPRYILSVGNKTRIWRIGFDLSGESIRIDRVDGALRSE